MSNIGSSVAKQITRNANQGMSRVARNGAQVAENSLKMVADTVAISGKTAVDAEVQGIIGQARQAFAKREFRQAAGTYGGALAARTSKVDAQAVLNSLIEDLEKHAKSAHLPWNRSAKVAPLFDEVLNDARRVLKFGEVEAVIEKSTKALSAGDQAAFNELHQYSKDLVTRIDFPYTFAKNLSSERHLSIAARTEASSLKLADHYLGAGKPELARDFVAAAKAPTISRPSFPGMLNEVKMYDAHGALADFSESQAFDLVLEARNLYRYNHQPIETTQNALLEILPLSLKSNSKVLPPRDVVQTLLTHARTADEVGTLLGRAEKLGYKGNLKGDVLGAITPRALGGVTMTGNDAVVQSVNPVALVAFADQHGFGNEANATLTMALNREARNARAYSMSMNQPSLGIVASVLEPLLH